MSDHNSNGNSIDLKFNLFFIFSSPLYIASILKAKSSLDFKFNKISSSFEFHKIFSSLVFKYKIKSFASPLAFPNNSKISQSSAIP